MTMSQLCSDCPPIGYSTDLTRCEPCPRRTVTHEGFERYHCACGQQWETDDRNRNDDRTDRCPECGEIGKPGWLS